MSDDRYEIDLEMMADFIDESLESLAVIPGFFVDLEKTPTNLKIVEAIFRPVHSLKGNAAYFGLMHVKSLSHEMESVLDLVRKGKLAPDRAIIDGLLAGIDEINTILQETRHNHTEVVNQPQFDQVLEAVRSLFKEPKKHQPPAESETDAHHLETWERVLRDLENLHHRPALSGSPEGEELAQILARLKTLAPVELGGAGNPQAETVSPLDALDDGNPLVRLVEVLKNPPPHATKDKQAATVAMLLNQLQLAAVNEKAQGILATAIEEFDLFMDKIGFDPMLQDSLLEVAANLEPLQSWEPGGEDPEIPEPAAEPAPEPKSEPVVAKQPEPEPAPAPAPEAAPVEEYKPEIRREQERNREPGRTMRVSEDAIDAFLGFVGELIAVDEMFRYIHGEMVKKDVDLQISSALLRVVNTFTKLSDDLQRSIMEIRKVSVRGMMQKNQRIVRDIAAKAGKLIDTEIIGADVTIDRSLLETLEAPMVHMVRNSADHGIEPPETRLATGKPEAGRIVIEMREVEDQIMLTISDDGKGLNYARIREKAVNMGLIEHGMEVSREHLADLIFASGFSTAEKVTDVSGRGVGMDAVKRAIESAGGGIELKSEEGKGTTFTIRLPKSVGTQILNSFVVLINEQRFVVPMDKISGSFRPQRNHFHRLPNGAWCIKRNASILPIICLDGPWRGDLNALTDGILITIESKSAPFAFYVDTILGMQKVVLRTIPWIRPNKFHGAAVMGDGLVSMIVNLNALESHSAASETQSPR